MYRRRARDMLVLTIVNGLLFNRHIKTAEQRVIGTLAVDGWSVTFSTARRGLGGLRPRPVPSSLYQM